MLGIFGREGVHTAAMWPQSSNVPFITAGYAMFRSFSGYPQVKYGVFLVVGSRTRGDTMTKVTDVERLATATITGATWNPLYAVWDLPAVIGGTSTTIDPKGQTLTTPIVRLTNFTARGLPGTSRGAATDPAAPFVLVAVPQLLISRRETEDRGDVAVNSDVQHAAARRGEAQGLVT